MSPAHRITILGCGSSGGSPRLGGPDGAGHWGACDPANPKNRRQRCSILVEKLGPGGVTRVLIDSGPDIHDQLLEARVGALDAVLYTHDHADHTHGIDDLRQVVYVLGRKLDAWADLRTQGVLRERFGYIFETPPGSNYPAILTLHDITEEQIESGAPIRVNGAGGVLEAEAFPVIHGVTYRALGFKIGGVAYTPDINHMTPRAWAAVTGVDTWIVDALRYDPHPSHANLETALEWIEQAKPRRAVLTNMHIDIDYETVAAETPEHVLPAYDGMVLEV